MPYPPIASRGGDGRKGTGCHRSKVHDLQLVNPHPRRLPQSRNPCARGRGVVGGAVRTPRPSRSKYAKTVSSGTCWERFSGRPNLFGVASSPPGAGRMAMTEKGKRRPGVCSYARQAVSAALEMKTAFRRDPNGEHGVSRGRRLRRGAGFSGPFRGKHPSFWIRLFFLPEVLRICLIRTLMAGSSIPNLKPAAPNPNNRKYYE